MRAAVVYSDRATAIAAFVLSAPRNLLQFLLFFLKGTYYNSVNVSVHTFFWTFSVQNYAVCPSLCITTRTEEFSESMQTLTSDLPTLREA